MTQKNKVKLIIFIVVDVFLLAFSLFVIFHPSVPLGNLVLLNPKGIIALKQRQLMMTAFLVMLIAVVPAFLLAILVLIKNKPQNLNASSSPDLGDNKKLAFLIWLIPTVVIFIISLLIWKSTHDLDPYRPIESSVKPVTIQVVALRWKWLFIYPEAGIATVNFIEIPKDTPINFELTADGPMSTFWIPQLSGQIYSMAGMETKLHIMANETGEYFGSTSEINGKGFAGMRFTVKSVSADDFNAWIKSTKSSPSSLTQSEYNKLAEPSENNLPTFYSSVDKNLYGNIMMKYMMPASLDASQGGPATEHMQMEGMQ